MKHILKNTWSVLEKNEKKRFTALTILDLFINIIDIVFLAALLWIIQYYVQPASATKLFYLPEWLSNKGSVSFIVTFFVLFGLKNIAGFLIAKAQYSFIARVAVRLSANSLSNYQHASFEEYVQVDSSVQIRKISLQPFEFCQYILSGIQQMITQSFLVFITIIAIVIFNSKLFFLILCMLLPPVILVFYIIKKRLAHAKTQIRTNNERSFQFMLDALKGYVESNIYNKNDFFMRRYITVRTQFSKFLFSSISLQSMPSRMIEIFAILGLVILIALANQNAGADTNAFITVGAFMAAAYKIIPGIVKLINVSGQIRTYEFSFTDLVADHKASEEKKQGGADSIRRIAFENVSFQYKGLAVLKDFQLIIEPGDMLGITGKSGKGKTTILNLLLGFLSPQKGRVCFNGEMADQNQIRKYWPSISYVRQQSFFIHDTVLKNISFEEEGHDEERLNDALKISGLAEMLNQFPEGLDKVITENGKNISGGQQQRVAIARALYKNADLVVLDEPFNELDEASETALLEYFRELASQGKMVIMITHDKKSLAYCNKTISLDDE
ncbi:MAG: ATP-binding cassette domain-containing protein [Flavisolibacter sp.]